MTKILTAKQLVDERIPALKIKCAELTTLGLKPSMKVILVGDNPASLLYIKNKKKLCKRIGADFELIHLPVETSADELTARAAQLNKDPNTTGLFIQLPLPAHLKSLPVAELISQEKDVDGFHPLNIYELYSNRKKSGLYPCTPRGIVKLLDFYKIDIAKKNIVVIGRSMIVGKPLATLLGNLNATVTLCHSKTKDLKAHTSRADIIISAVGSPRYFNKEYLRASQDQVLIDVGINQDQNKKLCGDMDFDNIKDFCQAITPVPGGIGPLTVLSLIENLMISTQGILENK